MAKVVRDTVAVCVAIATVCISVQLVYAAECPPNSPININTASESELDELFGIGPAKASDIVAYREANGYFLKTVDIQNVSGIGPATYENIKLCITVGSEPAATDDEGVDVTDVTKEDSQTTKSSSKSDNYGVIGGHLDENFRLSIKAPEVVYVNQIFSLDATPGNVSSQYIKRIKYAWNLGDGEAAYKQYIKHVYRYPGTYAVVLSAKYNRSEQVARHTITVLPVNFSITRSPAGDIQINNDAKYEINLTGYQIKGVKTVSLPENTILLPGGTITIPQAKLATSGQSLVRLYDEQGVMVANTSTVAPSPIPQVASAQVRKEAVSHSSSDFNFSGDAMSVDPEGDSAILEAEASAVTATATAMLPSRPPVPSDSWPYLGLIGLLAVGTFGVLYRG